MQKPQKAKYNVERKENCTEKRTATFVMYLTKYLHYICSSPIGQSVLSSLVQGSAQPNIAGSAFSALKIPVPPIEEQDHVISVIDDLSNADRVASERLTKSRALMGAMLAAMQEVQHVQ